MARPSERKPNGRRTEDLALDDGRPDADCHAQCDAGRHADAPIHTHADAPIHAWPDADLETNRLAKSRPNTLACPHPMPCGLLQDRINATTAGSTLDLTGRTFTAGATIGKPLTLVGATIHVPAAQKGLLVTSSDVTLDHLTILGGQFTTYDASESGIYANGSAASPILNLTIRNSELGKFGQSALRLRHVSNVTVTNDQIHDTVYAGIMILSGLGGRISHNTVQRIGVVGSGTMGGNAYGIALSDTEAPATSGITVDGNTVTECRPGLLSTRTAAGTSPSPITR